MRLTISEIMAATGAQADIRRHAGVVVESATADSRQAAPGVLFCCLPGSRADGHDFAVAAVRQGATAVLAARGLPEVAGRAAVLVVPDVLKAMGLLARFWRRRTRSKVAALSGSAGKTTAKELLASIAGRMTHTVKNPGNYNNQLGLPLSMLAAREDHRLWVLEVGVSKPGDMEELGAICEPDLAVVHNIGPAHLEGLGDLSGVAKAKAALFGFVAADGHCLANADYPELWRAATAVRPDVLAMSTRDPDAPFFAQPGGEGSLGRGRYRLSLQGETFEACAPCQGGHLAESVLAAAAAAKILGADARQIIEGLEEAELPSGRFQVFQAGPYAMIDDTYNANPLSMRAAIDSAMALDAARPVVLVLGQMGELGADAGHAHEALGRHIATSGCRAVFFKGEQARQVARGLSSGGFSGMSEAVSGPEAFLRGFERLGLDSATILFKGSRSQKMEEFLESFMAVQAENRR